MLLELIGYQGQCKLPSLFFFSTSTKGFHRLAMFKETVGYITCLKYFSHFSNKFYEIHVVYKLHFCFHKNIFPSFLNSLLLQEVNGAQKLRIQLTKENFQ